MRIAYFTAGTVGAGHLVRGEAVRRALRRAGFQGEVRLFSPEVPHLRTTGIAFEPVHAAREELDGPHAAESSLARTLSSFRPDLILVDLFWAPLRWVLPALGVPAWLLVRRCPAQWFRGPSGAPFDAALFARIFAIEPFAPPVPHERLDPLVVCNRDERMPRGALRALLGAPADHPLHVVVHAGVPGEIAALVERAGPAARVIDLAQSSAPFPAAAWLDDAERIVAAAGYNTFWESRWLGYGARMVYVPFPRRIDDQAWRVSACAGITPTANGADALAHLALRGG